jgi:hypothetical protein
MKLHQENKISAKGKSSLKYPAKNNKPIPKPKPKPKTVVEKVNEETFITKRKRTAPNPVFSNSKAKNAKANGIQIYLLNIYFQFNVFYFNFR